MTHGSPRKKRKRGDGFGRVVERIRRLGVEHVYCHVERANAAARGLYESLGYVAEAEESDWLAGKLGRPPRVLMRKSL